MYEKDHRNDVCVFVDIRYVIFWISSKPKNARLYNQHILISILNRDRLLILILKQLVGVRHNKTWWIKI